MTSTPICFFKWCQQWPEGKFPLPSAGMRVAHKGGRLENGKYPTLRLFFVRSDIGRHFNQRYEKKGYATESVTALFDYLFNKKGARRLCAWVEDYNISSRKLCQRLNMRYEGCLKEFVSFVSEDGYRKYDDTCICAILKKEWGSLTTTIGFS